MIIHIHPGLYSLELDSSTTLLLVTTQLEMLASFQGELLLGLAHGALETEDDLLGLQ